MKQYIVLITSVILFFSLFYLLNKPIEESMTNITPATSDIIVDTLSTKIDSNALTGVMNNLIELKQKLATIRGNFYDQSLSKVIQVKSKYKDLDSNNPQQFDVTIENLENFSNIINIDVPIGEKGIQGPTGNKGKPGLKGKQGEKGPVGNCGAVL